MTKPETEWVLVPRGIAECAHNFIDARTFENVEAVYLEQNLRQIVRAAAPPAPSSPVGDVVREWEAAREKLAALHERGEVIGIENARYDLIKIGDRLSKMVAAQSLELNRHRLIRHVDGHNHSTACWIWGDDGQGKNGGPCSCGALENFYRDKSEVQATRIAELEKERDLALAHDTQPYPTADAYEKVCAARTAGQERAEAAESSLTTLQKKLGAAEAEIDRRKGDPITRLHNLIEGAEETSGAFDADEFHRLDDEVIRLQKQLALALAVVAEARALQFGAYPAHGSGFVSIVTGGNLTTLAAALAAIPTPSTSTSDTAGDKT